VRPVLLGMGSDTFDIVRRTLAAFDAGDLEAVCHRRSRNVFNPNTYTGLDGVREWRAETDEIWEEMRLLPMEFHRRR